jgi:hypothetical protein
MTLYNLNWATTALVHIVCILLLFVVQKFDVTCSQILLSSFNKQLTKCTGDVSTVYQLNLLLYQLLGTSYFFLPFSMKEGEIIPIIGKLTRNKKFGR